MSRQGLLLSAALVLVLTGCAVKRDSYETPTVPLPASVEGPPGSVTAVAAEDRLPDLSRWWTRFDSAELNALVERALTHNWQVRAAVARLAQAEAGWRRTRADELPTLDAFGDAGAEAPRGGIGSVREGQDVNSERSFSVGLRARYEVDLWGANAAASEAAWERAQASADARRTVAWTLTADVVTAYLQVLSLSDRITTAEGTLRVLRDQLQAVIDRMEGGDADALQVAQQRTAVSEAAAVIPVLSLQRDQALHALAVLIGTTPDQVQLRGRTLTDVQFPTVAAGIPSHVLLRRPDIQRAEHELLAADADIDVARAAFLPSFALTAESGFGSNYLTTLLRPESLLWSLAASILQPIFDGGENEARLDVAEARHQELAANYMQAVYTSLREVKDALSGVHYLDQRLAGQREAVAAAREALALSREAYAIGTIDFITLLDTERTLFTNEDILHRIEFERANASVALFKALGGDAEAQGTAGAPPVQAAVRADAAGRDGTAAP